MDALRNQHVGDGHPVHFGPFSHVDAEGFCAPPRSSCVPAASSRLTSSGSRSRPVLALARRRARLRPLYRSHPRTTAWLSRATLSAKLP
jgi:hypothetical protein